jgi:hypothetical protein
MKLFYYKPTQFNPIIFLITKISNKDEMKKIEDWANKLFQILIEHGNANDQSIIIFSVIKDYNKTTENLILPSTNSNQKLTERCHKEMKFVNDLVVKTLTNYDTEFYIEVLLDKVLIHEDKLNLMAFSKFYLLK